VDTGIEGAQPETEISRASGRPVESISRRRRSRPGSSFAADTFASTSIIWPASDIMRSPLWASD